MNTSLTRRFHIQRAAAASACLGIALGLTACGGSGGSGPGPKQLNLVIGNSLPLTGIDADLGASGRKASRLALAQIRRAAGESGARQTVRIVDRDQGAGTASAVASAQDLVANHGASCLTGPWSSDAVEQTAQSVAIPRKVVEISPVTTSTAVADLNDHDLIDSTALPQSLEGSALSDAIEQELGGAQGRTVSVVASSDAYGETLSRDFIQSWQGKDGSVGGRVVLNPSLYASQAQQLAGSSPQATVVFDGLSGFAQFAAALSRTAWDPSSTWGSDRLVSPGLPAKLPAGAIAGMRAMAAGTPATAEASTAFEQDFRGAKPRGVGQAPFAAQEFDATILCYLAAVAAGSTDGQAMADELVDITAPAGEKFSWQQLPEAVKALEDGKDIDYTGASGPIDMDVHGDPTTGVFDVYRYTKSGLRVTGQVPVSKPNPAIP